MSNNESYPTTLDIEALRQALEQWGSNESLSLLPRMLWRNMTRKPTNMRNEWKAPLPTIEAVEQAFLNSQTHPYIYLTENEFLSCHKQSHQLDEICLLGKNSFTSEEVARTLSASGFNVKMVQSYDVMCWGLSDLPEDVML